MISPEMQKVLDFYNQGLELYKQKKFIEAKAEFQKAVDVDPDDGPSNLYIERCELFLENPPPEDWDGVFTMTSK